MAGSLREQLEANIDKIETVPEAAETAAPEPVAAPNDEPEKPGRTFGRQRDEHGRLMPGKAERPQESVAATEKPSQPSPQASEVQSVPPTESKPRPKYPSTWKRDYQQHWETLPPEVAEYVLQREGEYAKGVSTYKREWDQVKPLHDAIAPFRERLQQYGIEPAHHIQRLFSAHERLALGSPQDKLSMFVQLARDYQVPIEQMFVRGQDGQVYFNPQLMNQAPAQPPQPQVDVTRIVEEKLQEREAARSVEQMMAQRDKYPHFEEVRETMVGLLSAGLATDLADAYQAAIRHPRHADIWDAEQRLARESEEKRAADEKRRQAENAKRNAVSVKGVTPTGQSGSSSGGKGLRAALESNFDEVMASRV